MTYKDVQDLTFNRSDSYLLEDRDMLAQTTPILYYTEAFVKTEVCCTVIQEVHSLFKTFFMTRLGQSFASYPSQSS